MKVQTATTPLIEFLATHIQLTGWPTLCLFAWEVCRIFTKAEARVLTAESHITKMATNCFPTMQASLQTQDVLLNSVDESLKTLVERASPPSKKSRSKTKSRKRSSR